jgi:hypothetical protein
MEADSSSIGLILNRHSSYDQHIMGAQTGARVMILRALQPVLHWIQSTARLDTKLLAALPSTDIDTDAD